MSRVEYGRFSTAASVMGVGAAARRAALRLGMDLGTASAPSTAALRPRRSILLGVAAALARSQSARLSRQLSAPEVAALTQDSALGCSAGQQASAAALLLSWSLQT